jgi:hypothetical protein
VGVGPAGFLRAHLSTSPAGTFLIQHIMFGDVAKSLESAKVFRYLIIARLVCDVLWVVRKGAMEQPTEKTSRHHHKVASEKN